MTSPFLGGPQEDPLAGLLRVLQIQEMVRKRRSEQGSNLVSGSEPGATVQQIGLDDKQQKALYGRKVAPDFTPRPATASDIADQNLKNFLRTADPQVIRTLSASMASRAAGVPQITTPEGITKQGQASEIAAGTAVTEAQTKNTAAKFNQNQTALALQSVDQWKPELKARFAQQQVLGTTEGQQANDAQAERIKAEVQRQILQASSDPEHSDLNKALKTYTGVGIGGAMAAAGLGLTSLLDQIASVSSMQFRSGQLLAAELEKQMNEADTQWAKDVASKLGGQASPRALLNWKRWREAGGDPKAMPRDVSPDLDAALEAANAASFRAYMADAAEKGDPDARTAMELVKAATQVKDNNTLQAISQLVARLRARVIMNQKAGPRPSEDPARAALWDQNAQWLEDHTPVLKARSFLGMDFGVDLSKPIPNTFHPALGSGANTQPPVGAGAGAPAAPSPSGLPQFNDLSPEDAQKIQQVLQALKMAGGQQPAPVRP